MNLLRPIGCRFCKASLQFDRFDDSAVCANGHTFKFEQQVLKYADAVKLGLNREVDVRNRQAHGYLAHGKFPTQVSRLSDFIAGLPSYSKDLPALDLGCGPGPTTSMLINAEYNVTAIDFSDVSLRLNATSLGSGISRALFVQADLTDLVMVPKSTYVLVMADFLQHLGSKDVQHTFLNKALATLCIGGSFYLSFFNLNLKNWLKADVFGSFASGAIGYRRLSVTEVLRLFPKNIKVTKHYSMNIFHDAWLDRVAASFPFAHYLGRMAVIEGIMSE